MCKPWKANGAKDKEPPREKRKLQDEKDEAPQLPKLP